MKQTSHRRWQDGHENQGAPHPAGLTQQQLAELVHVSSRTIISIEKGQYSPSLMLSYRMAKVFGVTVEELCCLEENLKREDAQ